MKRILRHLLLSAGLMVGGSLFAQYPVFDVTGNATLSAIEGLSSSQVQLLGQILSENKQQLQSLVAIQGALNGTGGSGGSLGGLLGGTSGGFNLGSLTNGSSGGFGLNTSSSGGIGSTIGGNYGGTINSVINASGGSGINQTVGGVIGSVNDIQGALNNASSLSLNRISSLVRSIPGLSSFDLKSMFPSNGYIDIFTGMSPSEFKQAVSNPASLLSSSMMSRVIGDVSGSSTKNGGPNAAEIMFSARVAAMSERERSNNADSIARGVADILSARVVKQMEDAHNRGATFATMTKDLSDKNDGAATVMDKMSVSNQQAAVNAQMAIDANARASEAAAANSSQNMAQTSIMDMEQNRNAIRDAIGKKN